MPRKFPIAYFLIVGWALLLSYRIATQPDAGAQQWIIGILYLIFSVALAILLLVRAVRYVRDRARAKREGEPFLTVSFIMRFLIVGWLMSILFRFATFGEAPVVVSAGPFWAFSLGLIAFYIRQRFRRGRGGPPRASSVGSSG
jgi:hypothetical protein